jgi:hypothetical protein
VKSLLHDEPLSHNVYRHETKREKTTPSRKKMCNLWPPVHLAKEVGACVGRGEVLQRSLPDAKARNSTPVIPRKGFSAVERMDFRIMIRETQPLSFC